MKLITRAKNAGLNVLSGAYLLGPETDSVSRRGIFIQALCYNAIYNVLNGTYLTGFLLSFGASANDVNLAVTLLSLCNMIQLISPLFIERLPSSKTLLTALRGAAHGINMVLLPLLAMSNIPEEWLLPVVLLLISVSQSLYAFVSPGMGTWHMRSIPENMRLGFYSFFNVINIVSVFVMLFLAGVFADFFTGLVGSWAVPLLRVTMGIFAVIDILALRKIHEYPPSPEPPKSLASFIKEMVLCIRHCPSYGRIIACASLWSFSANLPSQYYTAYLLEDLHMSFTFISFIGMFNAAAVIVFTPFWKRLIQRQGLRNGLFFSIFLYAPYALGLAFTGEGTMWLYPVSVIYSLVLYVGITLSFSIAPYEGLPEERRTVYLALYNAFCALSSLLGVLAGRLVFTIASGLGPIVIWGADIAPARVLTGVYSIALLLTAFSCRALLREKEAGAIQTAPAKRRTQGRNLS